MFTKVSSETFYVKLLEIIVTETTKKIKTVGDITTIPKPERRTNNRLLKDFYPLQKDELMALRKAKLINNAAYVHFALRAENPFCDRPLNIDPKEFAHRWEIPESSVYKAIARLKELGILNIKSGKLTIEWTENQKPEPEPEPAKDYQIEQEIIRSENELSDPRIDYQIREKQELEALPDIDSSISQTSKTFQTNQTRGEEEKKSDREAVSDAQRVQKTEAKSEAASNEENGSVGQVIREVVQEKTKIISPSKKSADENGSIPDDLRARLEELEIKLDDRVINAIASHHISQAYSACRHVRRTRNSIDCPKAVFLYQLPKQPVEQLGNRYSEELLNSIKAQNQAIEQERSDPGYYKRSKDAFAQIRAKLGRK